MNRFGWMIVAAAMFCAVLCPSVVAQEFPDLGPAPAEPASDVPAFEDYIYTGQADAYARDGWAFVRENPQSNFSPGIVANILMLGQLANNEGLVSEMRRVLLFNYPRSVHAQHLIKTYPGDAELRKVLMADMQKDFMTRPEGFAARLTALMRAVIRQRGGKVLDDDQLLLTAAVAGEIAEDDEVAQSMRRTILARQGGGDMLTVAAIALDEGTSPSEKVVALTPYSRHSTARMVSRLYLLEMEEAQRTTPDVLRATAAVVLFDRRFSDALQLLGVIPEADRTDRDLFWTAWSHMAVGEDDEASATVATMSEKFPDSPWTGEATRLLTYLANTDERLNEYGEIISGIVNGMGTGVASLELKGSSARSGDRASLDFYIGALRGKHLELQLRSGDNVMMAYRDTVTAARLLTDAAPQVIAFERGGMMPEITIKLVGNPQSGFTLQTGFRVGDSADLQKPYLSDLVTSPYLSSIEGVKDLLRYQRTQGRLMVPSTKHGDSTVIGWAAPSVLEPEVKISTLTLADGRLKAMQFGGMRIDSVRYSTKDDLELTPPAWPDLPTSEPRPMVFTTALQVFTEFVRVLMEDTSIKH